MPWKCPACSTPIRQQLIAAGQDSPRLGDVYRCSVCRLELVLDPDNVNQLTTSPMPTDTADGEPPRTRSTR